MARTIGLQLYTLRDDLAAPAARAAVLERVAGLGVESVEPAGFDRPDLTGPERLADARALRAELASAGLGLSSVHTALPAAQAADGVFEALVEAGASIAVLPVPQGLEGFDRDVFADPDGIARYAEALGRLADVAARHGARVGYHNHWFEWTRLPDGRTGYDTLWGETDERVLAEVDLYWAQAAGQVPADVVARLGRRVQLVHVKDGPGTTEQPPQQVAPGGGAVPLGAALEAGAAVTTEIIEADAVAGGGDPYDYIRQAVAWLRDRRR